MEADDHAGRGADRHRQPDSLRPLLARLPLRSARRRLALGSDRRGKRLVVDHEDVERRVVDLHDLQRPPRLRRWPDVSEELLGRRVPLAVIHLVVLRHIARDPAADRRFRWHVERVLTAHVQRLHVLRDKLADVAERQTLERQPVLVDSVGDRVVYLAGELLSSAPLAVVQRNQRDDVAPRLSPTPIPGAEGRSADLLETQPFRLHTIAVGGETPPFERGGTSDGGEPLDRAGGFLAAVRAIEGLDIVQAPQRLVLATDVEALQLPLQVLHDPARQATFDC